MMGTDVLNPDTPRGFRRGVGALWRSGPNGKLFLVVSIVFIFVALFDAGPRYARGLSAEMSKQNMRPVKLSPEMPQYTLVSCDGDLFYRLEQCVSRVRDSLVQAGFKKAENAPEGYEMLALRPDIQIALSEQPLNQSQILVLLDARLECGCGGSSDFRVVRFRVDPSDPQVTVLRDQVVSWEAYLSNYRRM
ncbi:MAG: hypothetical protein AB1772_11060 [Candidatus Zixiibacteriota bacterium]